LDGSHRKWIFGKRDRDPLLVPSIVVFLAAVALRLAAVFNDLWLDEIWSLNLASLASSPIEIITKLTHDNNHPINSFYIWALGEQRSLELYRLLSVIAGAASVWIMGVIGKRYGRTESFTALVLGGFSYFLIHYSSEARGYAPAVFFALSGFLLAGEIATGKGWLHRGLFWLTVLLGLLSHSTYLFAYSGIFAWSALRSMKDRDRAGHAVMEMLKTHGIPLLFAAGEIFWLTSLTIGGGPEYPLPDVILETVRFTFGLWENRSLAVIACTVAAAVFLWEIRSLWKEKSDQWIFHLTTVFLAPTLVLLVLKPAVLFPRYFLVCVPFFLLLLARWMSRCAGRGTPGKIFYASFLIIYCSFNLLLFGDLLRYGRGRYSMTLEYIARQTEGETITVGSDHDFRNGMLVDFYSRYLPPGKKVIYVPETGVRPEAAPEWIITHRIATDPPSAPVHLFMLPNGSRYIFKEVFPSSTLSGFRWYLYRKGK